MRGALRKVGGKMYEVRREARRKCRGRRLQRTGVSPRIPNQKLALLAQDNLVKRSLTISTIGAADLRQERGKSAAV